VSEQHITVHAAPPPPAPVAAAARMAVSGTHIAIAWSAALITCGYLLPWAVAATRQKSNSVAIGLLTFLTGWTVVGWFIALVMACAAEPATAPAPMQVNVTAPPPAPAAAPPGWYPDATGVQRYWDGRAWTDHVAG
jgi:hypothetical protein